MVCFKNRYHSSITKTFASNSVSDFLNSTELITLEQWYECVNFKKTQQTMNYGNCTSNEHMETRKIIGYKLIKEYPGSRILGSIMSINCATWYLDSFILKYPEFWEPVYEKEKLEISSWCDNYDIPNTFYNYSNIIFKGKLTKEIIDKIKEVINEKI